MNLSRWLLWQLYSQQLIWTSKYTSKNLRCYVLVCTQDISGIINSTYTRFLLGANIVRFASKAIRPKKTIVSGLRARHYSNMKSMFFYLKKYAFHVRIAFKHVQMLQYYIPRRTWLIMCPIRYDLKWINVGPIPVRVGPTCSRLSVLDDQHTT